MRLLAPLLPAWLASAWLLATSDSLWRPPVAAPTDQVTGGWALVATVVLGSAAYLGAARLGRNLAVWTPGSHLAGLGAATPAQQGFGKGVVRFVALLAMYLLICGFVALELRKG